MNKGLLAQKEHINLVEDSTSSDGDGDDKDETAEQEWGKLLLARNYNVRGTGRCHDRSFTREHAQQHINTDTWGAVNSNDKAKRNDRIRVFQRMNVVFLILRNP